MTKILITGANGQLGREFCKYLSNDSRYMLKLTAHSVPDKSENNITKLDITDLDAVLEEVRKTSPDVIINCAAFTAVDLCETEEETAYQINAIGSKNMAIAANAIGAELVHISTDYVYDGLNTVPYTEESIPAPQNIYGETKLAGDNFVMENCDKYYIIRVAWVYGDGKNFVKTMLALSENHDTVRVVNDQQGTPTSTKEIVKMIMEVLSLKQYGIYHGTCEGSTTWFEFAKQIFKLAGKKTEVIPITTEEYKTPAKRPAYSVLENKKLNSISDYRMKDWEEALQDYMKGLEL